MKVSKIMKKDVIICSSHDTIASVLWKMKSNMIHQLPVIEKKEIIGMITLDAIARKEIDPVTTKVSSIIISTPRLHPEQDTAEAIKLILASNLRAVPVWDAGLNGIISETDVLKTIDNVDVQQVVREAHYVSESDSIGKVKKLMMRENVSRVPVVSNGKFIGIVGSLDVATVILGKQRLDARGGLLKRTGAKEKINIEDTLVKTIMREPVVMTNPKGKDVLSELQNHEEVLVENDVLGIITPKDILRTLVKPTKHAYIQIVGIEDESSIDTAKIYRSAGELIQRISKEITVQPMKIVVERQRKAGTKKLYEVRIQMPTNIGTFVSTKSKGWDFVTVAQKALKSIQREFQRKYDMIREKSRGKYTGRSKKL